MTEKVSEFCQKCFYLPSCGGEEFPDIDSELEEPNCFDPDLEKCDVIFEADEVVFT